MADINLGVGGANSATGGYEIDNSLKFEPDNTEMLYTGSLTAGNRRTWTISMWVKRTELSYESAFMYSQGTYGNIRFFTDDKILIENHNLYLATNRVFRDTSAWYHVVWVNDSTQSTASNRSKLYINGVQETSFSTENYMTQNEEGNVSSTSGIYIGRRSSEVKHFAGYIADVYKVDGQALAPTDFGEFDEDTGIWIPKEYTGGSYSTQGFHLDFSDSSNLGNDSSGENNDFLLQNITSADQATDTPTNNFATWQVLTGQPYPVIRNGATHYNLSGQVGWYSNVGSIAFTKGKWYAEFRLGSGITNMMAGVSQVESEQSWNNTHLGGVANSTAYTMGFYNANGNVYTDNGSTAWDSSFPAGTIIMVAVDYKTSGVVSLYFGTNGTWANSSNPETGANNFDMNSGSPLPNNLAISFAASPYNNGGNAEANFGGFSGFSIASGNSDENGYGTFEYAPPSGYYALCTKNLAEYG